ncbi:MAG: cytoplasmic protein, partial [Deltaproteobacteria bacterium]|nr:cytoplasmic protein [Deltaproteobacteria bacterium]
LLEVGTWDPREEYWGEPGEPLAPVVRAIIARGPRPAYEMEQVIPGADPDDFDSDPIIAAGERFEGGDRAGATALLMELLAADLRCLDAHAHLGNFAFERDPARAREHYRVGAAIGDLSLGDGFGGVLSSGDVDNRPFHRCLHGLGNTAWRLGDLDEARAVLTRLLWLDPTDRVGARFCLAAIAAGQRWEEAMTAW